MTFLIIFLFFVNRLTNGLVEWFWENYRYLCIILAIILYASDSYFFISKYTDKYIESLEHKYKDNKWNALIDDWMVYFLLFAIPTILFTFILNYL